MDFVLKILDFAAEGGEGAEKGGFFSKLKSAVGLAQKAKSMTEAMSEEVSHLLTYQCMFYRSAHNH